MSALCFLLLFVLLLILLPEILGSRFRSRAGQRVRGGILHFTLIYLLSCIVVCAEDGVVFRQQFKSGFSYRQSVKTSQSIESPDGKGLVQGTRTEIRTTMSVEDYPGRSERVVGINYERIAVESHSGGGQMNFDSDKPETFEKSGPLQVLLKVMGKRFRMTFDENDNVLSIGELDQVMRGLEEGDPTQAALMREMFSKEAVRRLMQQSTLRSPADKPVLPGESWDLHDEMRLPGIGRLIFTGKYTYVGMKSFQEKPCAEVKITAAIQLDTEGATGEDEDRSRKIKEMGFTIQGGKFEGVILYDPEIQFVRSSKTSQVMKLAGSDPSDNARKILIPMRQSSEMVLESFSPVK